MYPRSILFLPALIVAGLTLSAPSSLAQTLATSEARNPAPSKTSSPAPAVAKSPRTHALPHESDRMAQARIQTLLARAGFSPGLIDGKPGRKTHLALEHYQRATGHEPSGICNDDTLASLAASDKLANTQTWTRTVLITNADLALVTGPIPEDWNERAALSVSGYSDLTELFAERGWCSLDLLQTLNPGININLLTAGDEITLPDVQVKPLPLLARLEISLKDQIVSGFDSSDQQVLLTHCSIARLVEKRPVGTLHVQVIVTDPDYTFDPKDWPEVTNVASKLRIAPGPRTPVGSAWIGLDKPSYGLHGTVRPQDIGKTGSHGCFRLANWDAVRLAKAVRIGTVVEVKE